MAAVSLALWGCGDGESGDEAERDGGSLTADASGNTAIASDVGTSGERAPAAEGGMSGSERPDAVAPALDARVADGSAGRDVGGRDARDGGRPSPNGADACSGCERDAAPDAGSTSCPGSVGPVPEDVRSRLRLDAFYQKHVDAHGLPVLSSAAPDDRALVLACELLMVMLHKRDDVRQELIRRGARFVIIGQREGTAEVPEYGYRERSQQERDMINQRARGLGGQVASCGEENILCLRGDRYANESICLHEFAHTITTYGAYGVDRTFQRRLMAAYDSANASGILDDTYRKENAQEYWAEGAQDYFDTNASANPSNGIHNQVNTREELRTYDPMLYALNEELFPADRRWNDCHVRR